MLSKVYILRCDECGELGSLDSETDKAAYRAAKESNWLTEIKRDGGLVHKCDTCQLKSVSGEK
jgi:hypothetical protein